MSNYIDEKIIPLKLEHCGNEDMSLYDERNRLISYRDKSGEETEYEYGKHSPNITNNLGTHKIKYDILGRIILETDVYGFTREYEYNELGKIKRIKSGEFETLYDYYKGGLLQRKTYPDKRYEIFTYDKNLNVVKRENEKGDYVLFTYDKLNRLIEVKNNFSQKQSFEYDAMGNVIKETDSVGHVTEYSYSLGGKLTSVIDAMGNRTEYGYDKVGRLITVYRHEGDKELISGVESANTSLKEHIDAENIPRVTRYKRDLMGNIVSVTNALGYEETFSYDLLGRVTEKKDREGYNTAYSYTEAGDIKSIIYNDGKSVEYTYNSLRELSQVKDALGTINIEGDKFGRATKVVDYNGEEVSYRYGKNGERLKTLYPDGSSVSYEYDKYLRLTSLTSGNKRVDYTYDKDGRLIRKDMSDEVSSIYEYNERGLLSKLSHLKKNVKLEEYAYDYDLLGNKTKIVRNRDVNPKGIKENDNKEKIIHKLWNDSATFYYGYNALNRLIEVKRGDRLVSKYTYDAYGNRESLKRSNDLEIRYTYDALDRLIKEGGLQGNKTYEYDKRGNLIGITDRGKRVRAYDYDITGRLGLSYSKSGKARSYSYDGLGNRIGFKEYENQIGYGEDGLKTILGANLSELTPSYEENYILDRTRVYHNLLQNKTIKRGSQAIQSYVWDFNVAYMEEGEKEFTYLQDELGSTIRLLEQGEESQAIYGYDEFGEDTYCTQGHLQPFGYTGYRYDNVADTYFAQAREYVPGVGRFVGEDWIKGSIEQPFSLNQYGYCLGNPFGLVDYDGKKPRVPLANPSNAAPPKPRKYSENDVLQNESGAPYVGVFYLNIESGANGFGHAAMMLFRSDDTGDLYSYVGDNSNKFTAVLWGYNNANVNYAYGVDVENILNREKQGKNYKFWTINREDNKVKDEYNRAIYFPITNDSGKSIAAAAKETILNTNGVGFDRKDYKLLLNNCDQNARRWMKAGGIEIDTGGHIAPNMIYMYMTRKIDAKVGIYLNAKYGDFKEVWDEIHKSKDCTTVD